MIARVGSFLLEEKIGEGGMASVYRARHAVTDETLAIKVIRPTKTSSVRAAFVREVEAHARLVHPNIVRLYDVGEVDADAEETSGGELLQGSGFIAMELAQGTVAPHGQVTSWRDLEALLLQALDGLAYAHARGMIHRDLKPENLLCFGGPDGVSIKLADFGISVAFDARAEGDVADLENLTGTPLYMAPEQITANWQEFGPWTDLYALGCMAWELACGRPPFVGATTFDTLRAHLEAARPSLAPMFVVPAGFAEWVERAMAVAPENRFRRAADAGRALIEIGLNEIIEDVPAALSALEQGAPGIFTAWTHTLAPLHGQDTLLLKPRSPESEPTIEMPPHERAGAASELQQLFEPRPPVPRSWRQGGALYATDPTPSGLRLFPLRARPLVGREAERDALWDALRDAGSKRRAEVVVIQGSRGDGSSALVDWLMTRARELGAGGTVRADFEPNSPNPGFQGLVRRLYHAWGMPRARLYEFILEALPPLPADKWRELDARALTEVAIPYASEPDGPLFEFASPAQRLALASRLLRRLGRLNLPILVCDNAHADDGARALVEHLLETNGLACLVVVVLKQEAVDDDPSLRAWSDTIAGSDRVRRLELEPLNAGEHRDLVDQLLRLSPALADEVVSRTLGNPTFAVQLLTDWVERDALWLGTDGYRSRDGVELPIPDTAHALCLGRIERVLTAVPGEHNEKWRALELAALLGERVDKSEWTAVVGDSLSTEPLIEALTRTGLGRDDGTTFEFAFGLLTEALRRRVAEQGLTGDYHRLCAAGLERAPSRGQTTARRAEHWFAAAENERAMDAFIVAAREQLHAGGRRERARLVSRQAAVLEQMDVSADHRYQLNLALEKAEMAVIEEGDFDTAGRVAGEIYSAAIRQSDDQIACQAKRLLAMACLRRGDFEGAIAAGQESVERGRNVPSEICASLVAYGDALRYVGRTHDALEVFAEALALPQISSYWRAVVSWSSGAIAHARGDLEDARTQLLEVVALTKRLGHLKLQGQALNELGDIARTQGDFAESRRRFIEVREIGEQLESPTGVAVANLNLAQTELFAGDFARATRLSDAVGDVFANTVIADSVWLLRLALSAAAGDWEAVEAASSRLEEVLVRPNATPDDPLLVRFMARHAEGEGQRQLAAKLRALVDG